MKGAFFEGQQVSVLVSGSLWENPQTNLQRTKVLRNFFLKKGDLIISDPFDDH